MPEQQYTQDKAPRVSVIMAVYNGQTYLPQTIDSILNQTLSCFEFIIVDDGSTDKTRTICAEYACRDSRIKIIRNEQNLGLTHSLNKALRVAQGEYIARMDADDISLPERFEIQVQYLDDHPQIGLVGAFYQEIDEDGKLRDEIIRFPEDPIIVKWRLGFENPIPHPPIMMRRNLVDRVGGYDERWKTSQDYDLFTRLSKITKLANLPQVLFYWRVHKKSISSRKNQEQRTNALLISQAYTSDLLGERVPMELIYLLWHRQQEKIDNEIQLCRILYRLCRVIMSEPRWSHDERKRLRRYVGKKIFYLIRPYWQNTRTWEILILLFGLSPYLFRQLLTLRILKSVKANEVGAALSNVKCET